VVENPHRTGCPVQDLAPDMRAKLRITHRRVRPGCDQEIEPLHSRQKFLLENPEQQGHRHRAGAVGNYRQNPPGAGIQSIQSRGDEGMNLARGKKSLGKALSDDLERQCDRTHARIFPTKG
jgi:hypothetical protein